MAFYAIIVSMTEKIDENFYNQATQNILAKIRLLGMSAEDTEKAIKLANQLGIFIVGVKVK